MGRLRDNRLTKARHFLALRRHATALEIGTAAIAGEQRASRVPARGRESIGLSIALDLVRSQDALPTYENCFKSRARQPANRGKEASQPASQVTAPKTIVRG
jgi:hypothetical protein